MSTQPLPNTPNTCTFTDFQVALAVVDAETPEGTQQFPVFVAVVGPTTYRWILTTETAELMKAALTEILAPSQSQSPLDMPKGHVLHTPNGPKVVPLKPTQESR